MLMQEERELVVEYGKKMSAARLSTGTSGNISVCNAEKGLIEVAPLAYMRGRTLDNAFIILDEAQNTTQAQMKMFLTRIGFNSKAVITGDVTQIDLPRNTKSGLRHAIEVLADVEEISFNFFHSEDVVRHPVVARIVNAYEAWEEAEQKRKAALAAERKREEQEQK